MSSGFLDFLTTLFRNPKETLFVLGIVIGILCIYFGFNGIKDKHGAIEKNIPLGVTGISYN